MLERLGAVVPELLRGLGVLLFQGVVAVEKGVIIAGIVQQRAVGGPAGQKGAVVGLVLPGEGQAVAYLVADREGLVRHIGGGADRGLSGVADKDAGGAHVGEGLAEEQGLCLLHGIPEPGILRSQGLIGLDGQPVHLGKFRQLQIPGLVPVHPPGPEAGLLGVVFRRVGQLGFGVAAHLQSDLFSHGGGEMVQSPEPHEQEDQQQDPLQQGRKPAQDPALPDGGDQPHRNGQHQKNQQDLPQREGDPASDGPEKAHGAPGEVRIEGEPELGSQSGQKHRQNRQKQQNAGANQMADGAKELEHGKSLRRMGLPRSRLRGNTSFTGRLIPPAGWKRGSERPSRPF